jgi:hypothetical protein
VKASDLLEKMADPSVIKHAVDGLKDAVYPHLHNDTGREALRELVGYINEQLANSYNIPARGVGNRRYRVR